MGYTRKIDKVITLGQFREYLSSKNQISRRILEGYEELMEGKKLNFGFDDQDVYFYENIKPLEALVPGVSPRELSLVASKRGGDFGKAKIDTGYFKITERREILPSDRAENSNWSLDDWRYNGIDGLRALKAEVDLAIRIYERIFPSRRRHKKQG